MSRLPIYWTSPAVSNHCEDLFLRLLLQTTQLHYLNLLATTTFQLILHLSRCPWEHYPIRKGREQRQYLNQRIVLQSMMFWLKSRNKGGTKSKLSEGGHLKLGRDKLVDVVPIFWTNVKWSQIRYSATSSTPVAFNCAGSGEFTKDSTSIHPPGCSHPCHRTGQKCYRLHQHSFWKERHLSSKMSVLPINYGSITTGEKVPVLRFLEECPDATAIFIYPTKVVVVSFSHEYCVV